MLSAHTSEIASPLPRPGRAAGRTAMDVIFGDAGQLEIHDVRQVFDVQTARGNVGRPPAR